MCLQMGGSAVTWCADCTAAAVDGRLLSAPTVWTGKAAAAALMRGNAQAVNCCSVSQCRSNDANRANFERTMDAVNEALTVQEGPYFLDDFSLVSGSALFSSIETRLQSGTKSMWGRQAAQEPQRSAVAEAVRTSEPESRPREKMSPGVISFSFAPLPQVDCVFAPFLERIGMLLG